MKTLQSNLTTQLIALLITTLFLSLNSNANCNVSERYQTGTLNGKPYAFVDSNGDPYFMNSVNIRDVLYSNGYPRYSQSDFNQIVNKGFNSVRLALNWGQMEHSDGNFHTEAFDGLDLVISRAEQAGLTVVLDPLHIKSDSYWNLPSWAWGNVNPVALGESEAGKEVWNVIVNHGLSYVQEFVSRYCDNSTVVAIDLVNEPREPNYGGDLQVKNEYLIDMYVDWISTLRQIDNNKIFIVEPFYGNAMITQSKLAPLSNFSNIVWSFHDYYAGEGPTSNGFKASGYPERNGNAAQGQLGNRSENWQSSGVYPLNNRTTARADMTAHINVHLNVANNLGIPYHIGEFGIPNTWTGKTAFMCDKRTVYTSLDIPFTDWVWNKDKDSGFGIWHPNSGWETHSNSLVDDNCGTFSNPNPNPNPAQCNLIQNHNFSAGSQPWQHYVSPTANASLNANAGYADFTINNGSTNTYKIQLYQTGFQLVQGKTYEVFFRAKADANKAIYVKLSNSSDNQEYKYESKTIGTSWSTHSFTFTMNAATNNNSRISFGVGKNAIDIAIDDVIVEELNCATCTPGASCNDNDNCTVNDVYDANCNCSGTYTDADGDGFCVGVDANDNDPCVPVACCELIENGTFNNGSNNWNFWPLNNDANLTTTGNKANINITNSGTERWHVQLHQGGIPITSGKRYLISFKAKAIATGRNISIDVSDAANGSTTYYNQTVWLGTQANRKYFIFEPDVTNSNARLVFNLGRNNNNVEIDEVVFKELSCSNLNNLITNGHFDNGTSDWAKVVNATASGNRKVVNGFHKFTINNGGTSIWHVRLRQYEIMLSTGNYTLSFKARTNSSRSIDVKLHNPNNTNNTYYKGTKNITTDWKTFNIHINVTAGHADGRLSFLLGNDNANVFLDDIMLVKETGLSPRLSNESASITKEINDTFEVKSALDTMEDSIKAFPNPFNDKLTIELQSLNVSGGIIGLYSISGSLIQQQAFENEAILELNTNDLFSGMYLIQVSTNDKIYTKKLLKQ